PVTQLPESRMSSFAQDHDGNLWFIHAARGLYRLRGKTVAEHISWASVGLQSPATALMVDPRQGGLWLGLQGQIAYLSEGKIRASYTATEGLPRGRVNDLRFDNTGALWIATESGLSHLKNGHVITVSSENGLPCDAVHWSMEDDDRSVWLYMPCG